MYVGRSNNEKVVITLPKFVQKIQNNKTGKNNEIGYFVDQQETTNQTGLQTAFACVLWIASELYLLCLMFSQTKACGCHQRLLKSWTDYSSL